MVNDAKIHADEDRQKKEKAEVLNRVETLRYQAEKQLLENGDKIPEHDKDAIKSLVTKLKEASNNENVELTNTLIGQLQVILQKTAQQLNEQGSSSQPFSHQGFNEKKNTNNNTNNTADDPKVVDADFEVVN